MASLALELQRWPDADIDGDSGDSGECARFDKVSQVEFEATLVSKKKQFVEKTRPMAEVPRGGISGFGCQAQL